MGAVAPVCVCVCVRARACVSTCVCVCVCARPAQRRVPLLRKQGSARPVNRHDQRRGGVDRCEIKDAFATGRIEVSGRETRCWVGRVRPWPISGPDTEVRYGRPFRRTHDIQRFHKLCMTYKIIYVRCARGCAKPAPPARRHPPRTCRPAVEPDRARGAGGDPCQAGNGG